MPLTELMEAPTESGVGDFPENLELSEVVEASVSEVILQSPLRSRALALTRLFFCFPTGAPSTASATIAAITKDVFFGNMSEYARQSF